MEARPCSRENKKTILGGNIRTMCGRKVAEEQMDMTVKEIVEGPTKHGIRLFRLFAVISFKYAS